MTSKCPSASGSQPIDIWNDAEVLVDHEPINESALKSPQSDGPNQFKNAEKLFASGALREAEAAYLAVLAVNSQHAGANMGAARCARKRGDRRAALAYFQAVGEASPGASGPRLEAALELCALGRLDEAETLYNEILTLDPNNARARMDFGRCARKQGNRALALAQFQAAAKLSPGAPGPIMEVAVELRGLGRLDESETLYNEILKTAPDNVSAHMELGRCARKRGDHAAALARFQTAAALSPGVPGPRLEAATELRTLGQLDAAEEIYREVLAIAPNNVTAYMDLGHCARKRGNRVASLAYFQAAAALDASTSRALLEVATDLCELRRLEEADALYRKILALAPENLTARLGLGFSARARGNRRAAMSYFQEAADIARDEPRPRLEIANEQRDAGAYDAARQTVISILAQHPLNMQAMMSLGHIERAAGRYDASFEVFETIHRAYPLQADPLVEMAIDERLLGRQTSCENYLAQALALNPRHVQANAQLAKHAIMARDFEAAYQYYQRAATEQPWELTFQLGLLDTSAQMGHIEEAIDGLRALENSLGMLPALRARRIILLRSSGHYYTALQLAREATQIQPYSFLLWAERFQIEIMVGDPEHVEACLRNAPAATLQQKAQLERYKGIWAENRWQIDEALLHYEAANAMNPRDPLVEDDLFRTKLVLQDLDGARLHLQKYCQLRLPLTNLRRKSPNISQTHQGQILDDCRLDGQLAASLAAHQALPPVERFAVLRNVVKENPDNTAAAISLVVASRQSGLLQYMPYGRGSIIPKLITQFWDAQNPPEGIAQIMQSWPEKNPEYAVRRFDDAGAQAWLSQHYAPPVVIAYRRLREPAQKADLFRLAWLVVSGGVYVDADDRCLRPLDRFLPPGAELVVWQENLGTIGNNFIAATPANPVLAYALQSGVNAVNRGDSDMLWLSTGPGLLTRAFAQHIAVGGPAMLEKCSVLTQRNLRSAIGIHCAAEYKNTKQHWTNSAFPQHRMSPSSRHQPAV